MKQKRAASRFGPVALFIALFMAVSALQGCFPLFATGLSAGAIAAVDRRTLGAQTEDASIEWKASSRIDEKLDGKGHFNFTSFNRQILLTGEAVSAEVQDEAGKIIARIPNVRHVYNETVVGPFSLMTDRGNDAFITSKVKSRLVDNSQFNPLHIKVVTEANTVFLLGMVTRAEADAAIQVARTTSGVNKVIPLFEIITPAEARALDEKKADQ